MKSTISSDSFLFKWRIGTDLAQVLFKKWDEFFVNYLFGNTMAGAGNGSKPTRHISGLQLFGKLPGLGYWNPVIHFHVEDQYRSPYFIHVIDCRTISKRFGSATCFLLN